MKDIVQTRLFINYDDLCELVGDTKHSFRTFHFTTEVRNDSYVSIDLSDWKLNSLIEDLEMDYAINYSYYGSDWREQFENSIKLINILREEYGIKTNVLTYISW